MAKVTPISELRRATKTVICPACQEKGETYRVSEPFTTQQKATLAAASVVTAGIPAVYYLMGPRAIWLAQYCRHCNIRLTTYVHHGDAVFPLNSSMLDMPQDNVVPAASKTRPPARRARSPLGPPPSVDFKLLAGFADRYRSLFPDLILDVDWNRWLDMPVAFRALDRGSKVYDVSFFDFDLDGTLNPAIFWPARRDPDYIVPLTWTPERANLQITRTGDGGQVEVGLVQLAQSEWDVGMFFPKTSPGDKTSPVDYEFRHQEIGSNHFVFARGHPHFVWSSSEGPLLWTVQRAADGLAEPGVASEDRLILLDCYDRLVAMEHCKSDARWKEWNAVPRNQVCESHLNIRLYGSLPRQLVGEIVVSYVALSAQMRRKAEWDDINISD